MIKDYEKINLEKTMQIFRTVHRMKELPRQGEIFFGMKRTESDSIASHSFLVTWMARLLAENIAPLIFTSLIQSTKFIQDVTYCALVHDVSESVIGDLYYKTKDKIKKCISTNIEEIAINSMAKSIENSALKDYFNLYESPQTQYDFKIATVIKFADGLDAWLHGISTTSAWWPAWENYNRMVHAKIREYEIKGGINSSYVSNIFRRICDITHYPDFYVKIQQEESILEDTTIIRLVSCFKKMYTLKSLPRHGFTIFGMKRAETDTFAEHIFTSSFLTFLLSNLLIEDEDDKLIIIERATLFSLVHDLPSAISGDVSFDLQNLIAGWQEIERAYIFELSGTDTSYADILKKSYEPKTRVDKIAYSLSKASALIDSWEMGVTSPSAWKIHWQDYKEVTLEQVNNYVPQIGRIAEEACKLLEGKDINDNFLIQPFRLMSLNL